MAMERTARSDEQLVAQCQSGDFTAFEELYERYQRPILAYIYQITRNYDEAGCISQDVFLKVFEHVDRFDIARRFSTWFYTIARNASIDYLQSRSRKVMVTFTDLDRDADGLARVTLQDPASDRELSLWVDESYPYLMLFTGDPLPDVARRSLAVEPMTCPPNAFRSGDALVRLDPGRPFTSSWGIDRK